MPEFYVVPLAAVVAAAGAVVLTLLGAPGVAVGYAAAALLGVGAVIAIFADSRDLKHRGEWVPRWYLYVGGAWVLTPWVVSAVYLVQRHRHTGRPAWPA